MTEHLTDPHFEGERYVGVERRNPRRLRILGLIDHRTLIAATVLVITLLAAYMIVQAETGRVAAIDAVTSTNHSADLDRAAAAVREKNLKAQLDKLQADLDDAREGRSAIAAQIDALVAQLRQIGVEPVVTPAPSQTARPRPSPGPSSSPSHKPSHKPKPSPKPSPSPTCSPAPLLNHCLA